MTDAHRHPLDVTRREFLGKVGIGGVALAAMQGKLPALHGAEGQHFPARAKNVIYIHMAGSPPQMDLFDHKPKLIEHDRQPCPEEFLKNERFAFIKGHPKLLGTNYEFKQRGDSGCWMSELLPHLASVADELTLIKSMHTDQFNHGPAQMLLHTGSPRFGRASMGSWAVYGLGSENRNLPGFCVLVSGLAFPSAGKSLWGSGFLPTLYQGVELRSGGDPVLYLSNPPGVNRSLRRRSLDALGDLNQMRFDEVGDPETKTRMAQYELAFRMQMSVPGAMDIAAESESVREMYGAEPGKASFANNCLLARRLIENGVRFVQLYDWGWDIHGTGPHDDLLHQLPMKCRQTDRPLAALILDLKQRGLLDDTLVVWSGEFGRTPMNEERNGSTFLGRDHHPHCFTIWMAGAGLKKGFTLGSTDELGYFVDERPVHVHDLQATILHLLGLDHERLIYPFQGRDFRLTDVAGEVVPEVLA